MSKTPRRALQKSTRIKSTSSSRAPRRSVQPLPGSAEPLARTAPAKLTAEQRRWLDQASRREVDGWLHVAVRGSPTARGFQYGYLVADEYAESVRVYQEMTYQEIGMGYDFFVDRAS